MSPSDSLIIYTEKELDGGAGGWYWSSSINLIWVHSWLVNDNQSQGKIFQKWNIFLKQDQTLKWLGGENLHWNGKSQLISHSPTKRINNGTIDSRTDRNKGSPWWPLCSSRVGLGLFTTPLLRFNAPAPTLPYVISKGFKMEKYSSDAHSLSLWLVCTLPKCANVYADTWWRCDLVL